MNLRKWPNHWLLNEDHQVFRDAIGSLVVQAATDISHPNARFTLGGEDTQCQHFFTKLYTLMQANQEDLTKALLCCTRVPDPMVEIRYYRSVPRRSHKLGGPQLVESETGADFALTLEVQVPGEISADRSILGQAKLVDKASFPIPSYQLEMLLKVAGPESGAYLMWGPGQDPYVLTAENIRTLSRISKTNRLQPSVIPYGKPFAEFLVDMFLGLWFGKDFVRQNVPARIPKNSPTALYVALHMGAPPPNVVHFSIGSRRRGEDRIPGIYVQEIIQLE